jgi:hypothetical protein
MGLQVLLVTLIYYLMASLEWHVTTSWTSAQLPSSSKCNIVYLSVWRLILNDNERCDGQTLHNLLLDNKHWHISYLCIITLVKPVIHEPTKRQHSTIIGGSFITFCTVQPSTVGAHRSSTASCYSSKSHCVLCPQSSTTVCYVVKQFPCLHILTAHLSKTENLNQHWLDNRQLIYTTAYVICVVASVERFWGLLTTCRNSCREGPGSDINMPAGGRLFD